MILETKVIERINKMIHDLQRDKDNISKKEFEKRLVRLEEKRMNYLKRWLK